MSHLNWARLQIDIQVYTRHGAMQTGTGHVHSHGHNHVHSSATVTLVSKDTGATYLEHELLVSKGKGRVRGCS